MSDMDELEFGSDEKKQPSKVVIEDKRFDREELMREETPEEKAARLKREAEAAKEQPPPKKVTATESAKIAKARAAAEAPAEPGAAADEAEAKREFASLFELGIDGFLKQNLGVILNFAYINMGLVANPANGLVTQDLAKAKLAIDTFEFLVDKLKGQFKPQEEAELTRLMKDLKLNFMNAASGPAPKPSPTKKPG